MRNIPREGIPSQFNIELGQVIHVPDLGGDFSVSSQAKVIGIDRYTERAASGGENTWVSYTMAGRNGDGEFDKDALRFWAVDGQAAVQGGEAFVPRSFYVPSADSELPENFVLDRNLSGYVELRTEGDSDLSGGADLDIGALFTYRNADGQIWAEETFKGADRITFDAVFEPEGFDL